MSHVFPMIQTAQFLFKNNFGIHWLIDDKQAES